MPVKIQTGDNSSDPRVISLEAYMNGRANFDLHYYYSHTEASFGGQVIDAQWNDLQAAVTDYVNTSGTPEAQVALRFVHCFSPVDPAELFLRMQICGMVPSPLPVPPGAQAIFDLDTSNSKWYEIRNGAITVTNDEELFGPMYLETFFYKTEPQSAEMERLVDGPHKFVRNLVLPWALEIKLMYLENGHPENAGIHFAACSYTEANPAYSHVEWPHGMVVYLSNSEGHAMLDNTAYISIFHNKGADYSTICPPNCGVYIQPLVI